MVVPESQDKMYYPSGDLQRDAHVPDFNSYLALYRKSLENPEAFWKEVADEFFWKKPATGPMLQYNFDVTKGNIYVKCMEGAKTNMCYNVLDRHVRERNLGEKVAYYWEGNSPDHHMTITYRQLLSQVCRCANVLKQMGVKKGDRVSIYLPMIPELVYTMLACARIGAVHSIVFAGFSSDSLCERIIDAQSSVLVTADGVYRGEKLINLKQIADEALEKCRQKSLSSVTKCLVVKHHALRTRSGAACNKLQTPWDSECDVWWDEVMRDSPEECEPEWLDAEDPLFILYTSGSTGKPKVRHGCRAPPTPLRYLALLLTSRRFDHCTSDVCGTGCTLDIGLITGHPAITTPPRNGAIEVRRFDHTCQAEGCCGEPPHKVKARRVSHHTASKTEMITHWWAGRGGEKEPRNMAYRQCYIITSQQRRRKPSDNPPSTSSSSSSSIFLVTTAVCDVSRNLTTLTPRK
ncbi:acetyl-coenzyme A synthetase, cytoplasmic-like protein [Lates japonicus]|uniref:acetate--CoA ligase n=1 Tax=Lates japonicus TaxID=270547 RepID=A0AAD3MBF3_LATJO|nr:acetyl-coenzyme A synthetase, cytoplasmic-like protein [Lates japonicus]